ncbi:MAG: hypothetical protein LBF55_00575 [Prevotellaceae bacterium]|jgi:hypothetical protein|nr:hypothetical protein [Prevotellaceae bacterium]
MKKILLLSLVAVAAAACGPEKSATDVDSLIADPSQYVGKEVTFTGKAIVANLEAGRIAVYGSDSTKYIIVQAVDSAKVCPKVCGKPVEVVGSVVELAGEAAIVDSVCHTAFVAEKYYVAATSIKKAECGKEDGKACCKKDSAAAAACGDSTVAPAEAPAAEAPAAEAAASAQGE